MANDFDFAFGGLPVVASAPAEKPKMVVKNIAKLSDEALRKKLTDNGVDVPQDATRNDMIAAAKAAGLWNYSGDILNAKKKQEYASKGGNCGDNLAGAFGKMEDDEKGNALLKDIAEANEIDVNRWAHCNFGQKRMNVSNVLRGKIRRGEYVIVNTTEWNIPGAEDEAQG